MGAHLSLQCGTQCRRRGALNCPGKRNQNTGLSVWWKAAASPFPGAREYFSRSPLSKSPQVPIQVSSLTERRVRKEVGLVFGHQHIQGDRRRMGLIRSLRNSWAQESHKDPRLWPRTLTNSMPLASWWGLPQLCGL